MHHFRGNRPYVGFGTRANLYHVMFYYLFQFSVQFHLDIY